MLSPVEGTVVPRAGVLDLVACGKPQANCSASQEHSGGKGFGVAPDAFMRLEA